MGPLAGTRRKHFEAEFVTIAAGVCCSIHELHGTVSPSGYVSCSRFSSVGRSREGQEDHRAS
jgi:hypothetical protein